MNPINDFNRSISQIFTNSVFKEIAKFGTSEYLLEKLKKYEDVLISSNQRSEVRMAIENAYSYLSSNYRNEYVYKNTILNNILLGRHSLSTATMLNEFKIANSIADTVIINGTSTVYEIKTELDSPEKLRKQINDYKKVFAKVFLVTHHTLVSKYMREIGSESVGLLSLSGRFNLSLVKDAVEDLTQLSSETVMRALRKDEYSAIIKAYYGTIPNVSNIHFFSQCLKLVDSIDPIALHRLMLEQLRKRKPTESKSISSKLLPRELKHICLCINPSQKEYSNIINFLRLKL